MTESVPRGSTFTVVPKSIDGAICSFTGNIPQASIYYAIYPSGNSHFAPSDKEIVLFVPKVQEYENDSFANGSNPMVSRSEDGSSFCFKNLFGVLTIGLKGHGTIGRMLLTDNDEDFALWGDVHISTDEEEPYFSHINNEDSDKNTLGLEFKNGIDLTDKETTFNFVLPAGALAKGFSLEVFNSKDELVAVLSSSNPINRIERSSIRRMPAKSVYTDNYHVDGDVTPQKRYMCFGFDDFRDTDFSWVIPMFEEFSGHATFNAIIGDGRTTPDRINTVMYSGNEVGDHTYTHCQFWQNSPLWNGQNPDSPDGDQIPFPSNSQMRDDRGDGCNIFGLKLDSTVADALSENGLSISTAWRNLTAKECQTIRDHYSLLKATSMINFFDKYSNVYLGTTGSSQGSWDNQKGCYTGGLFTDCKTSANHEVWERIAEIMVRYYADVYGISEIKTWSLPGSKNGSLFFKDSTTGWKYYDEGLTAQANYLARFPSSYLTDVDGSPKMRSWTDVLREHGYVNSHDYVWPGRQDGTTSSVAMSRNYIYNAQLSRNDCLAYSLYQNKNVVFTDLSKYSESLTVKDMYAQKGSFYNAIESIRQATANGCVATGGTDTGDSMSEKKFLREVLNYCKTVGIELVNEAEAYDICFNHPVMDGNLVYNPGFRNTAKEFMPEAIVPTNPDGYTGSCSVIDEDGTPALVTAGTTTYLHFGIPVGPVSYSASIKGNGTVEIYEIRNSSPRSGDDKYLLTSIAVNNSGSYQTETSSFTISDNPTTEYEQRFEGLGDKVCGIRIVYSSGLSVKDINLSRVGSKTARTAAKGNRTIDICNGVWDE